MRWTEDRVKQLILHPDLDVRESALDYFTNAYSTDPTIMPLVIESIDTHGWRFAFRVLGNCPLLTQTSETVDWLIRTLNSSADELEFHDLDDLAYVLREAPCALLEPRESEILGLSSFEEEHREIVRQRLEIYRWDDATCWRTLEELCTTAQDEDEIDRSYAGYIVRELAQRSSLDVAKVLQLLAESSDDSTEFAYWVEPLMVDLAGRARLEPAVPLLIAKMARVGSDDDDEENSTASDCAEALTRIGNSEVIQTLADLFPDGIEEFRRCCADVLGYIHSDLAVETCYSLFKQATDRETRLHLAWGLVAQFATEGIDAAVDVLREQKDTFESDDLMDRLLQTCRLMEVTFPEFDEWQKERKDYLSTGGINTQVYRALREVQQRWDDWDDEQSLRALPSPTRNTLPTPSFVPPSAKLINAPLRQQKIGRNDPCPCGSGKKFKACCLGK